MRIIRKSTEHVSEQPDSNPLKEEPGEKNPAWRPLRRTPEEPQPSRPAPVRIPEKVP